jgi:hypothetical protein
MPKKKKWIHRIAYICQICEPQIEIRVGEIKRHLIDQHSYIPDQLKELTQRGIQFLDGSGFYQNTYEILDGEKKIGLKISTGETLAKEVKENGQAI